MTRTYQTEFPTFPANLVPAIVLNDGWRDASWHNDECPCFIHEPSGVALWVGCGDEGPRYLAVALEWGGADSWQHALGGDPELFETNDIATLETSLPAFIRPRALAHAFASAIEEEQADNLATIRARNKAAPPPICATHDFCDANITMADAFEEVEGRPFLPEAGEPADADIDLWNQAWDIARAERLTER